MNSESESPRMSSGDCVRTASPCHVVVIGPGAAPRTGRDVAPILDWLRVNQPEALRVFR